MVQFLLSLEQLHEVSSLLHGADWALAHGDLGTLANVATQLSAHVGTRLQRDLREIAELSRRDPDVAVYRWVSARERLHGYLCDRAEAVGPQ